MTSLLLQRWLLLGLLLGGLLVQLAGCALRYDPAHDPHHPVTRHRRQYLMTHPEMSAEVANAIASQTILPGMTQDEVMAAWGPPASCSRPLGTASPRMVCVYRQTSTTQFAGLGGRVRHVRYQSVLFEHGKVHDWQYH